MALWQRQRAFGLALSMYCGVKDFEGSLPCADSFDTVNTSRYPVWLSCLSLLSVGWLWSNAMGG